MDPFSITLGVVTLAATASKVALELKRLLSGAGEASSNIKAMLADLKALKAILESIEDGFEELDGRAPLTGYIGAHWSALKISLVDGCVSMDKLKDLLILVNKDVKYLDSARRSLRLKEANDQIVMYRQEIQAYKDALQLSFQSVIFFQQTTISENVLTLKSNYDNLHQDFDQLVANLDVKLTALGFILTERYKDIGAASNTVSVQHLREIVRTAATVVTSASTVFVDESTDQAAESWELPPNFGMQQNDIGSHADLILEWVDTQSPDQSALSIPRSNDSTDPRMSSPLPSPLPRSASPASIYVDALQDHEFDTFELPQLPPAQNEDVSKANDDATTHDAPIDRKSKKKRKNFSLSRIFSPRPKHAEGKR
ncbi:hypothetical protein K505DRAFT_4945 [Melanomma pulvis-pyrius CBS 109.77]|uniref:Fungal N-terminal domain-containing protein n=1 Tax=Melanomma pulvis-pyrius CBS 109.77 TaxID=1314802 RepID=A0A6A6XKF7_9PLEO|nr:hypothetical protein K505DRAFT_4945 [Melanomma pulvis-pyrius CBS 109.77]